MSELVNASACGKSYRGKLLTTVCGLTLVTAFGASADGVDHPTVWIELGSQLEQVNGRAETFVPAFLEKFDHLGFDPISPVQRPSRYAIGGEGKVSFEPKGSEWVLSAAVRYGRSNGQKALYQKLPQATPGFHFPPYHLNATASDREGHLILDFQAGKDVGLGGLSSKISSTLSMGVRFAQFTARQKAAMDGMPSHFQSGTNLKYGVKTTHHRFYGSLDVERSFRGVGPSITWDSTVPLLRADDDGINLDWGINGAVLFGRQKVSGEAALSGLYYKTFIKIPAQLTSGIASSYHHRVNLGRSRSVIVPNVGGFAGISFRYAAAKISLGYRADLFFGAMDGGLDSRKTYDRNFYGPYASISIGLGG